MRAKSDIISELFAAYDGDVKLLVSDLKKHATKFKKSSKKKTDYTKNSVVAEARGISRLYHPGKDNQVTALDDVSVRIHESEIVALVGPSGSGKSTLLNIFAGLDKPSNGTIVVGDSDITKMSDAELSRYRNQHIGFVFQFFYLQPFLNLRTNVEVPAMFSKTDKPSRAEYASEMIDAVGMSDRLLHLPKELSGGQMQRAAIARALVNKPRLLIADEPTGNLDSENAGDVMDLFDEVRHEHKTAVLLVTHDESIAARADRIIRLKDGRVQS